MHEQKETTVFPVLVRKISDTKTEKKPLVNDWKSVKTTIEEIEAPNFGLNIPDSFIIVDLDLYKNAELKTQIAEATGFIINDDSLLQRTVTGGEHHVFKLPDGDHQFQQGSDLLGIEGFDTRCSGRGFICSGEGYSPTSDNIAKAICSPDALALPDVLIDALLKPKQQPATVTHLYSSDRVNVPEIESALDFIDPDISYDKWLQIGMALQLAPSGLAIWDRWSASGTKYQGYEELQRKFEGFRMDGGITLGTLYGMAAQNGWQRPAFRQDIEGGSADDFSAIPNPNGIDPQTLEEFSKYAFLTHNDKFYSIKSGEMISVATFNAMYKSRVNLRGVDPMTMRERTFKATEFFHAFLSDHVVTMSMYAPSFAAFFQYDGKEWVNSYRPDSVPAVDPHWRNSDCWLTVENHYLNMFEMPEAGRRILQWMAFNVQHTGTKILWAPIVCGIEGDGKSSIANILSVAMGSANVKEVGTGDIKSGFNDWAEGAAVVAMEEIRVRGHNRHDVMNALKPLISNPRVSINKKSISRFDAINFCNYLAFTNHEDALVLDQGNRRWQAFFSRHTRRDEMLKEYSPEYWEKFHDAYRLNPEIIRGWLMDYDIADFNPNYPPAMPNSNSRMIEAARGEIETAMLEELDNMSDFFTTKQLSDRMKIDYRSVTPFKLGCLLRANNDFFALKTMRVNGKLHRPWCRSAVNEKLTIDYPEERDYDYRLKQAVTNAFRLNSTDHDAY